MISADRAPGVAIIGAGAMGCLFASRLAEQGADVTLVDVDKDRLAAIAAHGIQLTDDDGTRDVRVGVAVAADVAGPVDLVILFTKGMHSAAASRSVAHLAGQDTIALTLQNGIGNADALAAVFGADRVLMGTAHVPADFTGQAGVVTHGFGHLDFGGYTPAAQEHAQAAAFWLGTSGFDAHVAADANHAVWTKVAFNAALNAMAMICGTPNAGMNNEPGLRIAENVVAETVAIAAAKGVSLDHHKIMGTIRNALTQHAHHKASMLQDREHGRMTEIDTINGAIAREGAALGIATPVCSTLTDLVKVIEISYS